MASVDGQNPSNPAGVAPGWRGRGGRGMARGGRGRGRGAAQRDVNGEGAPTINGAGPGDDIGSGSLPATSREPTNIEVAGKNQDQEGQVEADDGDTCFICAGPVVHEALAPCNHRTCHICTLRLRALYKVKDCPHCRTPAPFVIFTDDKTKRYEDFTGADTTSTDKNIGIRYESTTIMEDTLIILRYNCPDDNCDVACLGWPDLHRHVRHTHHKKMCDLCSRHKKVFTHEQALFTDKELERHMKKGDDNPGAVDQSGFRGHPLCAFCGTRFYGDDELYVHCRESHERCFICDRHTSQPQYYLNREELSKHFRKDHFPCPVKECQDQQFIVFETEMDLKAHQLEVHGNDLSKDVRRDARMVDLSSFDLRTPYVQPRRGGGNQRESRGRGRGRDPNADPLPAPSAQPLRRDEVAFQRQLAVQTAQSVAPRTFGGQLTTAPPRPPASRPPDGQEPASMAVPRPSSAVEATTSALESVRIAEDLTPADQARQLRHRSVIDRASALLQNDPTKLEQFRSSISAYKSGGNGMTAAALIDSFFALFSDTSSNALGTLIREISELYEDKKKGDALRTAWNDWRAINEDYPSLPGPSSITGGSISENWAITASTPPQTTSQAKVKSNRILKLKSSTAQSSRSSVSRTRSWGSAASSSSLSSANAFPGLPPSNSSLTPAHTNQRITTQAWAPSIASGPSVSTASTPVSRPNTAKSKPGPARGQDAFPALPKAAKPQSTAFGYGSGMVRRSSPTVGGGSVWGGGLGVNGGGANGNGKGNGSPASGRAEEVVEGKGGKKKGNKGKKQVLMGWG